MRNFKIKTESDVKNLLDTVASSCEMCFMLRETFNTQLKDEMGTPVYSRLVSLDFSYGGKKRYVHNFSILSKDEPRNQAGEDVLQLSEHLSGRKKGSCTQVPINKNNLTNDGIKDYILAIYDGLGKYWLQLYETENITVDVNVYPVGD